MVMSSHPHTTFQKGVERIVGRGVGILLGTLIVGLFGEQKLLALGLEVVGLLAFFYAQFCGRLAYTYQNAGLYLQAMFQLGYGDPSVAWVNGGWMFLALVGGVAVAYLVSWITYAERDLSIVPGEGSLLPIRGEPLGRAAQVTVTMLLAQYVFFALDTPPDAATVHGLRVTVVQKRISLEATPDRFRPQEGHWEAPPLNDTLPVLSQEWKRSSTCRCCRGPSPRTFPAPGRTGIRAGRFEPYRRREHHWHRPNQCSSTLLRSRDPNIGYVRSAGEDDGDERYRSRE